MSAALLQHPQPLPPPPEPVEGPSPSPDPTANTSPPLIPSLSTNLILSSSKDLVALHTRLRATLLNCYAYLRDPYGKFGLVPHNELVALNADLESVRRVNASLGHTRRSAVVPAWPVPVFRTNAMLGPRDLVSVLETATHVLSGAINASAEPAYV